MKNRFIEKVLSVAIAAAILIGTVSVQYPLAAYAEGEEPGQQTEQNGDAGKDGDHLDLGPAAQLKVMVDGSHAEKALAVGGLEVEDLNDIGQSLDNVDDAHEDEDQGDVKGKSQTAHHAAQEEGSGVTHKDLGGVEVIDPETQQTARQGGSEDGDGVRLPLGGQRSEQDHHG